VTTNMADEETSQASGQRLDFRKRWAILQRQAHQAEVRISLRSRVGSPARGRVERRRTLIAVTLSHDQALLVVGTDGICYNAMGCRYSGAGGHRSDPRRRRR
jgi:hypothetical protein